MKMFLLLTFALLYADTIPAQIPDTPAGRQFSAWMEVFNSGDRERIGEFLKANYPTRNLDDEMRGRGNGIEVRSIERSTPTSITAIVQERDGEEFGRLIITVDSMAPYQIKHIALQRIPRPGEFTVARMSETEVIEALRSKLDTMNANDLFSGAVLLARINNGSGKVIFSKAYGLADREKNVANTLDTRFRVASINKMFTAIAILQLVQAGKIKLTDPVGKYIIDYPNKDVATKVTIHHLLTHTGGTGDIFGPEFDSHRLELRTHDDYIALYGKRGLAFEPGTRADYSNYGMILLGAVIERVTGDNYYNYIEQHVYKPAKMMRSGSEPENVYVGERSLGYTKSNNMRALIPNTDFLTYRGTAAGGGYSTVGDLMKFATALMSHKLLNTEYTKLLITGKVRATSDRTYAYGFMNWHKDDIEAIGHNGGMEGMNGSFKIYPQSGYVVVVLSNLDPPAAERISDFLNARLPK